MTLQEFIARLKRSNSTVAVAIIGSAGEARTNPASDYDVLIVLENPPVPLTGGVTFIEGRFTDIVFMTSEEVRRLSKADYSQIDMNSLEGTFLRWMQTARIEFDKAGYLDQIQKKSRDGLPLKPPDEGEIYSSFDKASYNLAHTRRMLTSDNPDYHLAVDMRLLYQMADLMVDYFLVRKLPWHGEKHAVRYWKSHDPGYSDLFMKCINEKNRDRKVDLYHRLASETMAPLGALWQAGETRLRLGPASEMTTENIEAAQKFWRSILAMNDTEEPRLR